MSRRKYMPDVEGRRVRGRLFFWLLNGNEKMCNTRTHKLRVSQVNFKDIEEAKDFVTYVIGVMTK